MNEGPTIEAGYIDELRSALEKAREALRVWDRYDSFISTGKIIQQGHDLADATRETITVFPRLLSDAKLGQLIREGGDAVVNSLAGELNFQLYQSPEPDERGRTIARAILRTLKDLADER